jgi:hypothetical protein
MLVNNILPVTNKNTVTSIIEWIKSSPKTFAATGSRFFGGATENSDWDFFVEHDVNLYDFLISQGFADISIIQLDIVQGNTNMYSDDSIVQVMEKVCTDGVVQIQLLQKGMFDFKLAAQKFLARTFVMQAIPKDQRKSSVECSHENSIYADRTFYIFVFIKLFLFFYFAS